MKNPALSKTARWSAPPEQPQPRGEQRGALTVLAGADVGAVISLRQDSTLLGRSPEAGVRIDNEGVSRCHARIVRGVSGYRIEDLQSTNGTYVDGVRVGAALELKDGMRIQIGAVLLRFSLHDTLEQEAARRMYEMSVRDGLTGLYNRRHFDERLTAEYAFAVRHRTHLGVLVIDVDHFKQINDRWGHPAGDAVLRSLGRMLMDSVRSEDLVARFGGEEFVVLCRGIDVTGMRAFGERIRRNIEALPISIDGGLNIRITASIGVGHNDSGASRGAQLVAAADAALYQAKRGGRNRVAGPLAGGRYSMTSAQEEAPLAAGDKPNAHPVRRRTWDGATRPAKE